MRQTGRSEPVLAEQVALTATAEHAAIARRTINDTPGAAGSLLHDLHTVALMHEHRIFRIATNDRDFARFRGIEIVNPAAD